jgi:hypothetical protein
LRRFWYSLVRASATRCAIRAHILIRQRPPLQDPFTEKLRSPGMVWGCALSWLGCCRFVFLSRELRSAATLGGDSKRVIAQKVRLHVGTFLELLRILQPFKHTTVWLNSSTSLRVRCGCIMFRLIAFQHLRNSGSRVGAHEALCGYVAHTHMQLE